MLESGCDLISILNRSRCQKGTPCTHASMGNPKGAFKFQKNDLDAFMKAYCDAVFRKHMEVCIIERHIDISPMIYDFDFRYNSATAERRYTRQTIYDVVAKIYELIERYFDITDNGLYTCVILEKPDARFADNSNSNSNSNENQEGTQGEHLIKDGFHLHFHI